MTQIQKPVATRLLRTDPAALKEQVTSTTLDARTATDLVKQAGHLGTLTPAQLDVFTAAAASPGASAVARDVLESFLAGLKKPASSSVFSFLSWKPAPLSTVTEAADSAVHRAPDRAIDAVREFLATVDPLLATQGLSQLLNRRDLTSAMVHIDEAPANNVPTTELLRTLLKDNKAPPPFTEAFAQVGKRTLDSNFAQELLGAAALSSSPSAAYQKLANLADSPAPMTECGRAFCVDVREALDQGVKDLGGIFEFARRGQFERRSATAAFERALADFDPVLAEKSHTTLLMSGRYPQLDKAYALISKASEGPDAENLTAFAKEALKSAYA